MDAKIKTIIDLLEPTFDEIDPIKESIIRNKKIININIKCQNGIFNSVNLEFIGKYIKRFTTSLYKNKSLIVNFDLSSVEIFADKNVYIIFEFFIFYLINKCPKFKVSLNISVSKSPMQHNNLSNCTFFVENVIGYDKIINKNNYINTFFNKKQKRTDTTFCFRQLLVGDEINDETPTIISNDIFSSLKSFYPDDWNDEVCKVIEEIICNVYSHNPYVCMIDIDYCTSLVCKESFDNIQKGEQVENEYKAVNISIINYGKKLLYQEVKDNLNKKLYKLDDPVYSIIYEAEKNHKEYFDEIYQEDIFYIITAFQKGVTSRSYESGNSGTGLTKLIQNISGKTFNYDNYVLSGKQGIYFLTDFLKLDKNGLIGFNEDNNYLQCKPHDQVCTKTSIFNSGTIFQLFLVYKL